MSGGSVAVLFQATDPPVIDGIRKPMKPGGYSDSGADIAYVLRSLDVAVVTPVASPDPTTDLDWVFPDTTDGIESARAAGADVLWANTVLFGGHPLESAIDEGVAVVGQRPSRVHRFDDKWQTNELLRSVGCPVARAVRIAARGGDGVLAIDEIDEASIAAHGISLPAIVKPIRGRGSQGVTRVGSVDELHATARTLLDDLVAVDGTEYPRYGDTLVLEEYLPGTEVTMTVMPPGRYRVETQDVDRPAHWCLPAVERFNHDAGITPYNGVVAVTQNSRVVVEESDGLARLARYCGEAAAAVGAVAPIRIDCRARSGEDFQLFDLNMKPNMTGAGRPGRDDQDSLSCMAARVIGWSYGDLLHNMLRQAWVDEARIQV